jgi:GAF domain-containing protein
MEPIPETLDALAEIDTYLSDETLADQLRRSAALAQRIAPDLAGISVASHEHGVTFTLVATDEDVAALDAVQYLTTGPCVEALDGQGMATTSDDLLNEPRWQVLGQATAAAGVRSTLTFPVMRGGEVVGTVNLYGRSDVTFDGKHSLLAIIFGAWAPGAVTNADLSFATRRAAEQAPERLRAEALISAATGVLASAADTDVDTARHQLEDAANRAGVPLDKLARLIIDVHTGRD